MNQNQILRTKLEDIISKSIIARGKLMNLEPRSETEAVLIHKMLTKIENTLNISNSALDKLDQLEQMTPKPAKPLRDSIEFSSIYEYLKFKNMGPISKQEVASTNIEALVNELTR